MRRWLLFFALFHALLWAICAIFSTSLHPQLWQMLLFYVIQSVALLYYTWKGVLKRKSAVHLLMLLMIFRLSTSLAYFVVSLWNTSEDVVDFVWPFMSLYLAYFAFEITFCKQLMSEKTDVQSDPKNRKIPLPEAA